QELTKVIGARTLDSPDLRTGLCIVLKRMDTGSAWIVANNPRSTFWKTPADGLFTGNRHLPLAHIVRASTAADTAGSGASSLMPASPSAGAAAHARSCRAAAAVLD